MSRKIKKEAVDESTPVINIELEGMMKRAAKTLRVSDQPALVA